MLYFKKFGFILTTLSIFVSSNLAACEGHDCCHLNKGKTTKPTPRRSIDSYKTIATSRVIHGNAGIVELYNGMKFEFKEQGLDCRGARVEVRREIVKSKFSVSLEGDNFVVDFGHAPPTFGEYILLIDGWEYPATRIL